MIIRMVQVVSKPGAEAEMSAFFHNEALIRARRLEGIVSILPGAARRDSPRDYSFTTVWRDLPSLQSFVGEDITRPHITAEVADLVETRTIKHYDLVAG